MVDLGMFVAGERRGRGVGSALVEAALDWARQVGAHKVSLAVWAHNHPARSLYAKFGFLTEGTRRRHYRRRHYRRRDGELWDAVNMSLILDRTTPGGPGAGRHQPPARITLAAGGITAGGGLVLRTWRATDVPAVVAAVSDPEIYRWLDGIPQPYTATDAEEFILTTRRDLAEGRAAGLAVTDAGELVGAIGLRLDAGTRVWVRSAAGWRPPLGAGGWPPGPPGRCPTGASTASACVGWSSTPRSTTPPLGPSPNGPDSSSRASGGRQGQGCYAIPF